MNDEDKETLEGMASWDRWDASPINVQVGRVLALAVIELQKQVAELQAKLDRKDHYEQDLNP